MHVPSFKGGGGTSFDPVVKWVNKTPGYNGLIYFTDGYGPSPARCRVPVLWCIYGGMKDTSHLKGKVIHVGEQEQDELPF
jgi:predicted metal-dependent peptidase